MEERARPAFTSVVVLGEMGILIDYSVPGTSNRQFALNTLRWLARQF